MENGPGVGVALCRHAAQYSSQLRTFRAETETHLNRCGYLRVTANLTFDVILEPYSNGRGARCLRSHSLSLKE